MVEVLFDPDMDAICEPGFMASLYDPGVGTGGMLSAAIEQAARAERGARIEVWAGTARKPTRWQDPDILIKVTTPPRIYLVADFAVIRTRDSI